MNRSRLVVMVHSFLWRVDDYLDIKLPVTSNSNVKTWSIWLYALGLIILVLNNWYNMRAGVCEELMF